MTRARAKRGTRRGPILVEFLGAAGSGKSIMSSRLAVVLEARSISATNFRAITLRKSSPWTILTVAKAMLRAIRLRPKSLRVFAYFASTLARHELRWRACEDLDGVVICDEGLLHRLRMFRRTSRGLSMPELAARALRGATIGDLVVVLHARAETLYARRTARGKPGDSFSRESVAKDVELMDESIATLSRVGRFVAEPKVVLTFDAEDGDLDSRVALIADAAQELLQRA